MSLSFDSPPPAAYTSNPGARLDARAFLAAAHDELRQEFGTFAAPAHLAASDAARSRASLVEICLRLEIHVRLLAELVYPIARAMSPDDAVIDEAIASLNEVRRTIAHALAWSSSDSARHDPIALLEDRVDRQFTEARALLHSLPSANEHDLETLGQRLAARRRDILDELGIDR